jgi:hypothetical protein
MMTQHDEQLALELDAFLTAQLQNRPAPPVDETVQAEAHLAAQLIQTAQRVDPDPVFLSALEARLATAASRQPSTSAPERSERPFWQNLMHSVKETFTMKRPIYALGGLAAVFIIGVLVWFGLTGRGNQPATVADGGAAATAVVAEAGSLPKLPGISQGSGRGMGGGGGDGTMEQAAAPVEIGIDEPFIWNPLADAQYTVNAPFPGDPVTATVYQQPATGLFTPEEVQRYAQLLGVNGPVYREVLPEPVFFTPEGEALPETRPWSPPTYYYVFDGQRQVSFYDANIYYFDQSVAQNEARVMMPFDQAAPIVEAFLRERGLLDFPYEIASTWGDNVEIRRLINGVISMTPEFFVSVNSAGEIMSLSYQPFNKLQAIGDYPLRPAADAWQQILDEGFDYHSSYWFTMPDPNAPQPTPVPYEPMPWEELYRYWPRTFNDGDPMTIIGYPLVYLAVNGDAAPRIMVDQYLLSGATADLEALAAYAGQPVRIEGIARGAMPTMRLELTGWRPAPNHEWQSMQGAIRFDGAQVLFDSDTGESFVVPNAPVDLTDGERVNLSGWSIESGEGPLRIFNWSSIDRIIDWEALQPETVETMPIEPGDEYKITDVVIDAIDLIYTYGPIFDADNNLTSFMLQPAWRFRGVTNTSELIEIVVQAAASEFVEPGDQ